VIKPGAVEAPGCVSGQRTFRRVGIAAAAVTLAACGATSTSAARQTTRRETTVSSSTTTTTRAPLSYQVKRGDTLTTLAHFFGVSIAALASANHLPTTASLNVGDTLVIPPRQPVQLLVSPGDGPGGTSFTLSLTGAQPNETVTFQIAAPGGTKFTGPPHTAAEDGSVTTMYQSGTSDPTGTYTVVASGNQGTSAQATLRIAPSSTPT
jgi:LysM repeat protein